MTETNKTGYYNSYKWFWSLGCHLNFEFVSYFVLRISQLVSLANRYIEPPFLIGLIWGTQHWGLGPNFKLTSWQG
jgi:hypothetical protein